MKNGGQTRGMFFRDPAQRMALKMAQGRGRERPRYPAQRDLLGKVRRDHRRLDFSADQCAQRVCQSVTR